MHFNNVTQPSIRMRDQNGKKKKEKKRKETHQSLEHLLFARILGIFSLGTCSSFSIKNLFLAINSATLTAVSDKLNFI